MGRGGLNQRSLRRERDAQLAVASKVSGLNFSGIGSRREWVRGNKLAALCSLVGTGRELCEHWDVEI